MKSPSPARNGNGSWRASLPTISRSCKCWAAGTADKKSPAIWASARRRSIASSASSSRGQPMTLADSKVGRSSEAARLVWMSDASLLASSSSLMRELCPAGEPLDARSILSKRPELLANKSFALDLAYADAVNTGEISKPVVGAVLLGRQSSHVSSQNFS